MGRARARASIWERGRGGAWGSRRGGDAAATRRGRTRKSAGERGLGPARGRALSAVASARREEGLLPAQPSAASSDPDPAWFGGGDGVELPKLPHVALSLSAED